MDIELPHREKQNLSVGFEGEWKRHVVLRRLQFRLAIIIQQIGESYLLKVARYPANECLHIKSLQIAFVARCK